MKYLNIETMQYPLSEEDIKRENPTTSYPFPFNPGEKYSVVFPVPSPTVSDAFSETVIEGPPFLTSKGHYEQTWQIVSKYSEYVSSDGVVVTVAEQVEQEKQKRTEELSKNARQKRKQLLLESDWTQVADAPVDKLAWATYRQQLRDITLQEGFPLSITWPEAP
jgi:hypothetical protein